MGYGSFISGLAIVRAHGYTQSPRQTWNDFNHDHYLLWPQINYPFFTFKAQPIQVHNGVAYVSHMGLKYQGMELKSLTPSKNHMYDFSCSTIDNYKGLL